VVYDCRPSTEDIREVSETVVGAANPTRAPPVSFSPFRHACREDFVHCFASTFLALAPHCTTSTRYGTRSVSLSTRSTLPTPLVCGLTSHRRSAHAVHIP
jgi:hypothetical protein